MGYGQGGHRGALVVGGTEVTGVGGAVFNWNLRNTERGGWGNDHDYAIGTQPGTPTIDVEEPTWDPDSTVVTDLIDSMLSGGTAVCYLYPQGQDDLTKYFYGTFILDSPSMGMTKEDAIEMPFGLIAARPDVGRFGI